MNTTTTLYIDYLLQVITISEGVGPMYRWAVREMDDELREQGYINCGSCPFDDKCNMLHRGACAYGE